MIDWGGASAVTFCGFSTQPVQTEPLPLCSLLSAPNTDAMGGPQLPSYIRDEKNSGADGQAGHGTGKAAETPQLWAAY